MVFNYLLTCRIIYNFYRLTDEKGKYISYSDYHDNIFWDVTTCSLVEKHD